MIIPTTPPCLFASGITIILVSLYASTASVCHPVCITCHVMCPARNAMCYVFKVRRKWMVDSVPHSTCPVLTRSCNTFMCQTCCGSRATRLPAILKFDCDFILPLSRQYVKHFLRLHITTLAAICQALLNFFQQLCGLVGSYCHCLRFCTALLLCLYNNT